MLQTWSSCRKSDNSHSVPCLRHASFDFHGWQWTWACIFNSEGCVRLRLVSAVVLKIPVSVFPLLKFRVKNHAIVIPFSIFPLWCKYLSCLLMWFWQRLLRFEVLGQVSWSSHIYWDKRKKLLPFVKFPFFQHHFKNGLLSSAEFLINMISGWYINHMK